MLKLTPTTAQTVALHTLESALLSALITLVVGIGQYIATNGLNFPSLFAFAGALFVGSMGMVYKSLSTNPSVMQGVADTVKEAQAAIQQDVARLGQAISGGQVVTPPQLIQAPAQLDAASVADTILAHLDLGQVAQGVANELLKVRMPQSMPAVAPQAATIPQRPTMQPVQGPPYKAG